MVIPWIGFELRNIIREVKPMYNAKYLAFESIYDPDNLPGQKRNILKWPYREGLRLDEAINPLAVISVGLYGKVLPNKSKMMQNFCGIPEFNVNYSVIHLKLLVQINRTKIQK